MNTETLLPSGTRDDHLAIIRRALQNGEPEKVQALVLGILGDALEAVRKLPDEERRFLSMGSRTNWSIPNESSANDRALVEKSRVLGGITAVSDMPMKTARGADDALLALEWMRFLRGVPKDPGLHDGFKILLAGDRRLEALKVWRPGRKYSRTSVAELRGKAVTAIVKGLARTFDIDLDDMLRSARAA